MWKLYTREETDYFPPILTLLSGTIWTYYLFHEEEIDLTQGTVPSYEMVPLFYTTAEPVSRSVDEMIDEVHASADPIVLPCELVDNDKKNIIDLCEGSIHDAFTQVWERYPHKKFHCQYEVEKK